MDNRRDDSLDRVAFRRRCLKPDPERLGTWTARRLGRPAALCVTRFVIPLGMTANHATVGAMLAALGAVAAFGCGTTLGWCIGSLSLLVWYLLDHVDGQLARWHGTASLDGTTVDYLMHHSVNLLLPIGLGFGLMLDLGSPSWCLAGIVWGWSSLLLGLRHDARYKAFVQRLKLLHGELNVVGGGGGRPEAGAVPSRSLKHWLRWIVLKSYEAHVVMGALLVISVARVVVPQWGVGLAAGYLLCMALPAPPAAVKLIASSFKKGEAEREFTLWYRVRPSDTLEFRDGWWHVEPIADDSLPAYRLDPSGEELQNCSRREA